MPTPIHASNGTVSARTNPNQHNALPVASRPVIEANGTPSSTAQAFSINDLPTPPITKSDDLHVDPDAKIATTLEKSKYAEPTPESQEWYIALLKADDIQKTENIDLLNIIGILNNIIIHMNTKKELSDVQVSLLLDYLEIILLQFEDSKMLKDLKDMIFGLIFKPETDTNVVDRPINEIIQGLRTDVKIDATLKQHIEKYIIEKLNFPKSKYHIAIQLFRNIPIDSDLSNIKDAIILALG